MNQNKLSILFPWQDRVTYQAISEETWHNLGLDAVVEKVAKQPSEVPLLQRVMTSLTADPEVSRSGRMYSRISWRIRRSGPG